MAARAFARAAGAPLIAANAVRLLRDAEENYPAWLAAIAAATRYVHFESYIIHADREGDRFSDALIEAARRGVQVRLLYDWLGGIKTPGRFWRRLRRSGIEVRVFNPPWLSSPVGWISRDHRKMLAVDGEVAYVTGLCVGQAWVGDPQRGQEPWRDTGVEVRGPAVASIEQAFVSAWSFAGPPGPLPSSVAGAAAGRTALRVIASEPSTGSLYRLDKVVAALARERLWLTDAYFIGSASYVQALIAAARDGVDVRLLVPGSSDIPVVRAVSRAGYRTLLEGGVRVFEWNGTMLHAKTAVADGFWSRIGSTNLNPVSWLGNWELDVAIEDQPFATAMEQMFVHDLERATEVVLRQSRLGARARPARLPGHKARVVQGRTGRAFAGVVGIGQTIGSAITRRRLLGRAERPLLLSGALLLAVFGALAIVYPRIIAIPLAVLAGWTAIDLMLRAYRLKDIG